MTHIKAPLNNNAGVERVVIVGSGGAGKTTLAVELGRRTGLSVLHLDRLYWRPGWERFPNDEWAAVQAEHLEGEHWIVDGNYSSTYAIRFQRADTIVVLATPKWRCTLRVLRRQLAGRGREVQAVGCPERFDLEFLRYVWKYPRESRPLLDAAIDQYRDTAEVIQLSSPSEVRAFLDRVQGTKSPD